jgi:hypothetical protein
MSIAFSCTDCGQQIQVPDSFAGKRGKCRQCGSIMAVPPMAPYAEIVKQVQKRPPMAPQPASVKVASPVGTGFKMGIGMILGAVAVAALCVVLWIVFLIATADPRELEASRYWDKARESMQRGEESSSIGWMRLIIQEYPETRAARGAREIMAEFHPRILKADDEERAAQRKE